MTNDQKKKLLDYARDAIDGKPVGSFRYLIYTILGMPRGHAYSEMIAEGLLGVNNALLQLNFYAEDLAKEPADD